MTKARLNAIGYCARMTEVGDWALRYALDLARRHGAKLDIFFFPTSPCEGHEPRGRRGGGFEISDADAVEIERRVRLYYDELLGDYVQVGFRLCLGDEAPELRRCLFDREYDVLVLAYERRLCPFGERTIEEFAERMQCPVILVGPGSGDEFSLNRPAQLRTADLGLEDQPWTSVSAVSTRDPGAEYEFTTADGDVSPGDPMSRREWYAFGRELNERTGLNACIFGAGGARVTAACNWSSLLCPVILADRRSAQAVCRMPQEVHGALAGRWGRTAVDECRAGLVRILLPVFADDEYRGLVGCCGVLMEGSEVDVDFVAAATGLSPEAVTSLSESIPRISEEQAGAIACDLEVKVASVIARVKEARGVEMLPS